MNFATSSRSASNEYILEGGRSNRACGLDYHNSPLMAEIPNGDYIHRSIDQLRAEQQQRGVLHDYKQFTDLRNNIVADYAIKVGLNNNNSLIDNRNTTSNSSNQSSNHLEHKNQLQYNSSTSNSSLDAQIASEGKVSWSLPIILCADLIWLMLRLNSHLREFFLRTTRKSNEKLCRCKNINENSSRIFFRFHTNMKSDKENEFLFTLSPEDRHRRELEFSSFPFFIILSKTTRTWGFSSHEIFPSIFLLVSSTDESQRWELCFSHELSSKKLSHDEKIFVFNFLKVLLNTQLMLVKMWARLWIPATKKVAAKNQIWKNRKS